MYGNGVTLASSAIPVTSAAYGGNLFIDTAEGNTAYGDFSSIGLTYGVDYGTIGGSPGITTTGVTLDFVINAFDVHGTVYGITNGFTLSLQGVDSVNSTTHGLTDRLNNDTVS